MKLMARDRVAYVKKLANEKHPERQALIWAQVRAWKIEKIEKMIGLTMTTGGLEAKCIALAKRELSVGTPP